MAPAAERGIDGQVVVVRRAVADHPPVLERDDGPLGFGHDPDQGPVDVGRGVAGDPVGGETGLHDPPERGLVAGLERPDRGGHAASASTRSAQALDPEQADDRLRVDDLAALDGRHGRFERDPLEEQPLVLVGAEPLAVGRHADRSRDRGTCPPR